MTVGELGLTLNIRIAALIADKSRRASSIRFS